MQAASLHSVVSNSVPLSLPIGTNWFFSKRLISPSLRTLKTQATLTSELIVPLPAGAQPLPETRMVGEFSRFHSDQLGPVLLNVSPPHPHSLRPGLRLSPRQNQLPKTIPSSFFNVYSLLSETLNSISDFAPFLLNFSRTPLTPLLLVISIPITPPGTLTSLPTVLAIPYSIGSHPPS